MHSNQSPGLPETSIAGRYTLLARLGGGSFADTFLAADRQLDRRVALKLLRAGPHDAGDAARFEREIQAAAAVHHPNVVAIYDAGEHEGRSFLVMEWVGGSDLKRLLRERAPLPVDEAVALMRDVLRGLGAIHRAGIVHRDVKPQNILLTESGTAKVADFGIARSSLDTGLTETGVVLGTAAYLAPERAVGDGNASPAADIYAAGVLLFELLTGRLPFQADTSAGLLYQHVHQPPPDPRDLNQTIPPEIAAVVLTALAKDPAARYPSADAMQAALDQHAPAAAPPPDQPTRAMAAAGKASTTRRKAATRHARRFPAAVAALVVGALGLAAVLSGFAGFNSGSPGASEDPAAAPFGGTATQERVAQPAATTSPSPAPTASPTATTPPAPASDAQSQPSEGEQASPQEVQQPAPPAGDDDDDGEEDDGDDSSGNGNGHGNGNGNGEDHPGHGGDSDGDGGDGDQESQNHPGNDKHDKDDKHGKNKEKGKDKGNEQQGGGKKED